MRSRSSGVRWRAALVGGILAALLTLSSHARADRVVPPPRIESPRGVALGSGARAAAASTQAHAENPANLVLGALYHIESFLAYDPQFRRFGWGGAVVDSMTSRLAAGISARTLFGDNAAGDNKGWEGRLSLAFPLADMLSVGISGRYSNLRVSDPRAVPERPATLDRPADRSFKLKAFTMDAALTLRPIPGLAIAALGYNLIDTGSVLAPQMVGGSIAFATGGLTVGGDVLVDLNRHETFDGAKLTVGGGLEYLVQGMVPVRVGYMYDQGRTQNFLTAGLGFVDPRFGLQFGLRQSVSRGSETTIFSAVQYFVR